MLNPSILFGHMTNCYSLLIIISENMKQVPDNMSDQCQKSTWMVFPENMVYVACNVSASTVAAQT